MRIDWLLSVPARAFSPLSFAGGWHYALSPVVTFLLCCCGKDSLGR